MDDADACDCCETGHLRLVTGAGRECLGLHGRQFPIPETLIEALARAFKEAYVRGLEEGAEDNAKLAEEWSVVDADGLDEG
jgi:hypothetical protein